MRNESPNSTKVDSKVKQENGSSEEVDLIDIFKFIGKMFDRFFNFINSVFKSIFYIFIYFLKPLIQNLKFIVIIMAVAAVVGFALEKFSNKVYASQMLVKPYFDSKFQLVTNVNYYNALIADKDYNRLSEIFSLDDEDSKSLLEFNINPGPETENDRILQYENFVKRIDSIRRENIKYDDYIDNRSIYSGELFEISVKSLKKDIFRPLEQGLNSTFVNKYSTKKMKSRDSLIVIEKERLTQSLTQIDSLKKVYINVLQKEPKSVKGSVSYLDGMPLVQDNNKTREFELLSKELQIRKELTDLTAKKIQEDVYFDTISSFQEIGAVYKNPWKKYSVLFPILAFGILIFIFISNRFIRFVKSYEIVNQKLIRRTD